MRKLTSVVLISTSLVGSASIGGGPALAGGGICALAPDAAWIGTHTRVTTELEAAFDTNKNLILAQMTQAYQRMMSAIKVDTSQQSMSGQQVSQSIQSANEAFASTLTQTDVNRKISEAYADFGPDGQSVNACSSAVMIDEISSAISVYKTTAQQFMTSDRVAAAPGSTTRPDEAISQALSKHRDQYCSADEVAAGLCEATGSDPSADVKVETILTPDASEDAKDAFMNNIVGLPLPKPTPDEAKTTSGALMMVDAMRAEAVRSPALVSLSAVRAMNEGSGGADAEEMSVNEALAAVMRTYGGGPDFDDWYTKLATKNEHGLLQELNKIRALSLKLKTFRGDSNARIAATMAALLSAESDG